MVGGTEMKEEEMEKGKRKGEVRGEMRTGGQVREGRDKGKGEDKGKGGHCHICSWCLLSYFPIWADPNVFLLLAFHANPMLLRCFTPNLLPKRIPQPLIFSLHQRVKGSVSHQTEFSLCRFSNTQRPVSCFQRCAFYYFYSWGAGRVCENERRCSWNPEVPDGPGAGDMGDCEC